MKITRLLLCALLLTSFSAHAEFVSGNRLYAWLSGNESEKGTAYGYIAGVFDATAGVHHCPPETVTLKQISDIVQKALEKTPEHRDKSADLYVVTASRILWPCKQSPQRSLRL